GKTTAVAGLRPTENNALLWNAPNPFTQTTTINYRLPVESSVQPKVYDLSGRLMSLLVDPSKGQNRLTTNLSLTNQRYHFLLPNASKKIVTVGVLVLKNIPYYCILYRLYSTPN
ncbi:MAG: hypothetical protein J4G05_09470, partial [Chlorobi bacterium]|nr:hypothetical protein [Chlorobiota bacterium]